MYILIPNFVKALLGLNFCLPSCLEFHLLQFKFPHLKASKIFEIQFVSKKNGKRVLFCLQKSFENEKGPRNVFKASFHII
jgi:hypothetical protein